MPTATDLTSAAGGQIGALLGLYNQAAGGTGTIQSSYRSTLDGIAKQVIDDVNTAYQAGDPTVPDFFESSPPARRRRRSQVNPAVTALNVRRRLEPANSLRHDVAHGDRESRRRAADQTYAGVRRAGRKRRAVGRRTPNRPRSRC